MEEATQIMNPEETDKLLLAQKAERARKKKEAKRKRMRRRRIQQGLLILAVVLVVVLLVLLVKGCAGGKEETSSPVGIWSCGVTSNYMFSEDGTGILTSGLDTFSFDYEAKDGRLTIDFDSKLVEDCWYTYSIKKDTLTLVAGEGTYSPGTTYKLSRVKTAN